MKKVVSIVAVAVLSLGMFSCEAETNVQDTESLFETLEQESTDGNNASEDERGN